MVPSNVKLRALLLVTLLTFLAFQATARRDFTTAYCACHKDCMKHWHLRPRHHCHKRCLGEWESSIECPSTEMMVGDDYPDPGPAPDLPVAVGAAGGGDPGKGHGTDETGAAPPPPSP